MIVLARNRLRDDTTIKRDGGGVHCKPREEIEDPIVVDEEIADTSRNEENIRRADAEKRQRRRTTPKRAIDKGLKWLSAHQSRDGRWDSDQFMTMGDKKLGELSDGPGQSTYDGESALWRCSVLEAGETHRHGTYRITVAKALKWLRAQQDADGCFGSKSAHSYMYNHALGALAMTRAYGITSSPLFRRSAERGVAYVMQCQNPYKAWRYKEADGQNDTSITTWMLTILKAATEADIKVDVRRFGWGLDGIEEMTDEDTGRTGYIRSGENPVRTPDQVGKFASNMSEALTAAGICARLACGKNPKTSKSIQQSLITPSDLPVASGRYASATKRSPQGLP